MSGAYTDYRFKAMDLPTACAALVALRERGVLGSDEVPLNMLGDPQTVTADDGAEFTVRAARGRPASSYTNPDTGASVPMPAAGDAAYWYIAIRSVVPPSDVPVDLAQYGLEPCSAEESAAVLGAWA